MIDSRVDELWCNDPVFRPLLWTSSTCREQECFTFGFRPRFRGFIDGAIGCGPALRLDSELTKSRARIPSTIGMCKTGVGALIGDIASSRVDHTTINSMAIRLLTRRYYWNKLIPSPPLHRLGVWNHDHASHGPRWVPQAMEHEAKIL